MDTVDLLHMFTKRKWSNDVSEEYTVTDVNLLALSCAGAAHLPILYWSKQSKKIKDPEVQAVRNISEKYFSCFWTEYFVSTVLL